MDRTFTRAELRRIKDVAAPSAALLFNLLAEWRHLPAPDLYTRLRLHLEATLLGYLDVPPRSLLPLTRPSPN